MNVLSQLLSMLRSTSGQLFCCSFSLLPGTSLSLLLQPGTSVHMPADGSPSWLSLERSGAMSAQHGACDALPPSKGTALPVGCHACVMSGQRMKTVEV
jgi:hypothetical protein